MKIRQKFDTDKVSIKEYLQGYGVEDVDRYLQFNTIEDDDNYDNMNEAVALFKKHIKNNGKIGIVQDSDVDGLLSTSLFISFVKEKYNIEVIPFFHDENPKSHGLKDGELCKRIKESDIDLLIIPDAQANCRLNKDIDIIVLDHHNNPSPYCNVLINCQFSPNVENKSASGTLVTWHFLHKLDANLAMKYISYPAISIISDSMSFTTCENATFVHHGLRLENIHKNLLPILEKLQSSVSRKTGERVWRLENDNFAWGGIIPNANAVIRVGTLEQKQNMLKLFCGMLDGKELKDTLSIFSECKKEQTNQTEDLMENHIKFEEMNENVLIAKLDIKTSITGLVANKLQSKYHKPVLLVHDNNQDEFQGSARSPYEIQSELRSSGFFTMADGHEHAFGVAYEKKREDEVKDYLYHHLTLSEPAYDVFTEETLNSLSNYLIDRFEPYKGLWGNDLPKPLYYIKNIKLSREEIIQMKGTIKFEKNEWTFIRFFTSQDWIDENIKDNMIVDVIGYLQYNEWNGNKTKQFVIEEIEIREDNKATLFEDLFG